jgi:hypothetical protein
MRVQCLAAWSLAAWLVPAAAVAQHGKESAPKAESKHAASKSSEHGTTPNNKKPPEPDSGPAMKKSAEANAKADADEARGAHTAAPDQEAPSKTKAPAVKADAGHLDSAAHEEAKGTPKRPGTESKQDDEPSSVADLRVRVKAREQPAQKGGLAAALERIGDQIANMHAEQARPAGGVLEVHAPARRRAKPAAAPTRITLRWRTTLSWSSELEERDGSARRDLPRVSLDWASDWETR